MEDKTYYRLHLIVSGMVQGVGFRFFSINRAHAHGISGWVKNLYDGRVEIEAEGKKQSLIVFLEDIRTGPRAAHVAGVQQDWNEIPSLRYRGFDIAF